MHRFVPWTLNALTVLSLLLCVVATGLWVGSRADPIVLWQRPLPPIAPYPAGVRSIWVIQGVLRSTDSWSSGLFGIVNNNWAIPLYWIAVGSTVAAYPLTRSVVRRAWRRKPLPDCCASCGYSLIGNTSGVCPECGSVLEKKETISN